MKTYKTTYKGMTIQIDQIDEDRVEYKVLRLDGSVVEDSEGYCVTVDEAMRECKDIIDDFFAD